MPAQPRRIDRYGTHAGYWRCNRGCTPQAKTTIAALNQTPRLTAEHSADDDQCQRAQPIGNAQDTAQEGKVLASR